VKAILRIGTDDPIRAADTKVGTPKSNTSFDIVN
jgi:hypothetical protein